MIAFLACALYCTPIFSQVIYNRLMEQIAVWDTTRIERVLAEKFNDLINANKEKWISQVNYAKENYDVTVVFQAIVSYDDAGININIERNDFPLELYYSDKRDVKLRVLTYKGEIAFVDYSFSGLMIGIAKKEEKAFRYIGSWQICTFQCSNLERQYNDVESFYRISMALWLHFIGIRAVVFCILSEFDIFTGFVSTI